MNKKLQLVIQIIFYGALWGFFEATVGWALHWVPALISGTIMFPIAGVILYKAYQRTNSAAALFYVGTVAAMIKAVNFFLPNINMFKVLNPMIAILMEALVVVVVVKMITSENKVLQYSALPVASVGWRVSFVLWMTIQSSATGQMAPYLATAPKIVTFILLQGLISGVLASGLLVLSKTIKFDLRLDKKPVFSSVLLIVATLATYFIA